MLAVINAWVQSKEPGGAKRAEELLTKMEESYKGGDESIWPNVVSYSTVMNGWSKSNSPKKLKRAVNIFQRMYKMHQSGNVDARPNFVSFVILIDVIVKSGEKGLA